jgi:hypothetical protein
LGLLLGLWRHQVLRADAVTKAINRLDAFFDGEPFRRPLSAAAMRPQKGDDQDRFTTTPPICPGGARFLHRAEDDAHFNIGVF